MCPAINDGMPLPKHTYTACPAKGGKLTMRKRLKHSTIITAALLLLLLFVLYLSSPESADNGQNENEKQRGTVKTPGTVRTPYPTSNKGSYKTAVSAAAKIPGTVKTPYPTSNKGSDKRAVSAAVKTPGTVKTPYPTGNKDSYKRAVSAAVKTPGTVKTPYPTSNKGSDKRAVSAALKTPGTVKTPYPTSNKGSYKRAVSAAVKTPGTVKTPYPTSNNASYKRAVSAAVKERSTLLSRKGAEKRGLFRKVLPRRPAPGQRTSMSDVTPWQLFNANNVWDSSKRSPQQHRTGALDVDLQDAVKAALDQLNSRPTSGEQPKFVSSTGGSSNLQPFTAADFRDGRYQHHPGRCTNYVLNFARGGRGQVETVRLKRPVSPLSPVGSPRPSSSSSTIRLVVPYYRRPEVFGIFIANVAHLVLVEREPLELVVVFYWRGSPAAGVSAVQRDRALVMNALQRLNRRAGRQMASLLDQKRPFSRGHALLRGAEIGGDPDVLIFFIDVDMFIDSNALRRCRTNTSPGRSVYYPIVFSTYNPELRAQAWNQRQTSLWSNHPIDPDVGFWRDFGYGMTCQYRSDFQRVAGSYLISNSWGGEDEKLFQKHRRTGIEIIRAPDPGLVHVHHESRCDQSQTRDKIAWCEKSQMITEASAATWSRWVRRFRGRLALVGVSNYSILNDLCDQCVRNGLEIFRP